MKTCNKCNENKNFDQFYNNSRSKDGKSYYCKTCSNDYKRARRGSKKKYKKRSFISDTHKQCTRCDEIKSLAEFAKNSGVASGVHSWCRNCMSNRALEYRGGRVYKQLIKTDTHKQCRICEEIKPYSEYSGTKKQQESYCTECKKFMGTEKVLKKYGLTVDTYMQLFYAQEGVCKICKNPERDGRRLSVDHDHACCSGVNSCGKCIRGLLCSRCNRALGIVNDDVDILNSMIEYLL